MAARLVDLQGQLRRVDDQRHLTGGALGSAEQCDRLFADALRVVGQAQVADRLEATAHVLPAGRLRVAAALHLVLVERHRLDPRARIDDLLLDPRALGRGEGLPLPPELHAARPEGDPRDLAHHRVCLEEQAELLVERDREWVFDIRGPIGGDRRRRVVEDDRLAGRQPARTRNRHRLTSRALDLRPVYARAAREAPRPVDEDANPEAGSAVGARLGKVPVLDGERLRRPVRNANVGVPGARRAGGVEGEVDQLLHCLLIRPGCRRPAPATHCLPAAPATAPG